MNSLTPALAAAPRPKVCHLIHDGSSYGGGATISRYYFPAYLDKFEVVAITGDNGTLAEELRTAGVRSITLPMRRPMRTVLSFLPLCRIIKREKPDLMIVHGQWGGLFGAFAAWFCGIRRVIYFTHFPSFYTDWSVLKALRNHLVERITCRLATRVICLSRASRYQYILRHLAPEKKLVYMPNGVAPLDFSQAPDRAALLRELQLLPETEGPLIVSVSRLSDQKRIDWLIRAWAQVEREEAQGHLVIVGGGPDEAMLKALVAELKLTRCHLIGPRSPGYLYFKAADFGVICSLFEAANALSLTEAMFGGCPMIGTVVDGIAETIRSGVTGLLVPPGDPPALAKAILTLMRDPAHAQSMAREAKIVAERRYRLTHVIERQMEVVRQVLDEGDS